MSEKVKVFGTNPRSGEVETHYADDRKMARFLANRLVARGLKDVRVEWDEVKP